MQNNFKVISENLDLKGKRVLVRVDFNIPVADDGTVKDKDAYRIEKTMPTIALLQKAGAKIVLIGHIEDEDAHQSFLSVFNYLKNKLPISFCSENVGPKALAAANNLNEGEIMLLENLRNNAGEKSNNFDFAEQLSELGDIYVNEAFSNSHREHASMVSLPKLLPSYAGLLFESEVKNLSKVLNPEHPFLFILGGAKFETKLPLLKKYLELAEFVFVGGALANDFFREMNFEVGKSLVSEYRFDLKQMLTNPKLLLPPDVVVTGPGGVVTKQPNKVLENESIIDIGPESVKKIKWLCSESKMVLWNGPMGNTENGFKDGTVATARAIGDNLANNSIVGGGDSVEVLEQENLLNSFDFVSTGGGAMLDFLLNGTLPAIAALSGVAA